MVAHDHILIATLGSEAQVVTLALDLLRERGHPIKQVVTVHTAPREEVIATALTRLQEEFAGPAYADAVRLRTVLLESEFGPVSDVDSESGTIAIFRTLFSELRAAKRAGQTVHLCIAGGRKTMALFGMTVAQLLFGDEDRLWHLISTGALLTEKRMHLKPSDDCRLIPIPIIQLRHVSLALTDLHRVDDPLEAVERLRQIRLREQMETARAFVLGTLTGAERRVVELLVREGLPDAALAQRLHVTPRTVGTHLEHIYAKARVHWGLESVNRTQLVGLLSFYFTVIENREDPR